MNPRLSTLTRRTATLFVAALVVLAAATPVSAAACCQTRSMMASMHGTMPCCNTCKISAAENGASHDVSALSAPAPAPALAAVAVATAVAPATFASVELSSSTIGAFSPPPTFLLNAQFRI